MATVHKAKKDKYKVGRIRRCYCSASYSIVQFPRGCPLRHDFWVTQYSDDDARRIPHDVMVEDIT